jgi:hypothetical protein
LPTFTEAMAEINASGTPVSVDDENTPEGTLDDDSADAGDEGGDDNPSGTVAEPEFDPSTITDPQLQAQYKMMQAAFTPRLQEAADIRRQYGDLEPTVVDAVRQYQNLLQTDPFAAREFLSQQQAWLDQQLGTPQKMQDPFAQIEPLTPSEEALVNVGRQMWEMMSSIQQENHQLKFARQQEAGERQFAQLEAKYKVSIPLEEKREVQAFMQQTGITDVSVAWKALSFDKAEQRGAQGALKTQQQKKKSPPPPTNKQARVPQGKPTSNAKGIAAHFDEAWNQFNQ